MPFHAQSLFTAGPRRPLTIGDRALWLARLHTARLTRAITASHAEVARALLRRLGVDGRLDPSLARLAADTGLCERTVSRAVRRLAEVGLLAWQRRLVRQGWRVAQTSNAYALMPQHGQYQPCVAKPLKTYVSGSMAILSTAAAAPADVAEARAALARIAASLPFSRQGLPSVCPMP